MLIVWEYISVQRLTRLRVGNKDVRFVWSVGRFFVTRAVTMYGNASAGLGI